MDTKIHISIKSQDKKIQIESGKLLSQALDASNSPILFGCRTGICGTCLVKVIDGHENISMLTEDEKDYLELLPDPSDLRLACQFMCTNNVTLEYLGKGGVKR